MFQRASQAHSVDDNLNLSLDIHEPNDLVSYISDTASNLLDAEGQSDRVFEISFAIDP